MLDGLGRAYGRAARRAVRAACRPSSAASCCTARATSGSTSMPERPAAKPTSRSSAFNTRGSIRRWKKPRGLSPALRSQLGSSGRRSRLLDLRRQPAARRRLGRAASAAARSTSICRMPLGELLEQVAAWKLDARERKIAGELVREVRNRLQFLVDVGLGISHARSRPPRRSRAAKPSAFAWPARSAAACAACCMCSTSRRSACTRATTAG